MMFNTASVQSFFNAAIPSKAWQVPAATKLHTAVAQAMDVHVQKCARAGFAGTTAFIRFVPGIVTTALLGAPKNLQCPVAFRVREIPANAAAPTVYTYHDKPHANTGPLILGELGYHSVQSSPVRKGVIGLLGTIFQDEGLLGITFAVFQRALVEGGTLLGVALGAPIYAYKASMGYECTTTLQTAARHGNDISATLASIALYLPRKALDISRATIVSSYNYMASLGAYLGAAVGAITALAVAAKVIAVHAAGPGNISRFCTAVAVGLICGIGVGAVTGTAVAGLVCLKAILQGSATWGATLASAVYAGDLLGALVGCTIGFQCARHHFTHPEAGAIPPQASA